MSKVPLEGKHNVLLRRMSVYGNFKGQLFMAASRENIMPSYL